MFCNRNKIIDIYHWAETMVQHPDLYVVPWHKPCQFALRFNKVLMDGKLDGKNRFSTNTFIKLNNS
jgi:hypothetical protein